jgi:hypothetical protein
MPRAVRLSLSSWRPALCAAITLGALLATRHAAAEQRSDEACPTPPFPTGQAAENRARKIFQYAVSIETTRPRDAFELYKCARKLSDRPVIALRLGTLGETLGETDMALVALTHYLELAGADAPDADDIRRRLDALRAKKRAADPGVVVEGAPVTPESKPAEKAAPDPRTNEALRTRTIVGIVGLAAGAVVAGAGGYLLYDARTRSEDLAKTPPGRVLWDSPDGQGKLDDARHRQTIGIVGLSVGGALVITGAVLCLTGGNASKNVEVSAGPARGGFVTQTTLRF